jgi:hypothetical protein
MNRELGLIGSISLGAAAMYLLDPDRGNRRRAILRDKLYSAASKTPDRLGSTARDIRNRTQGITARVSSMFSSETPSDDVLVQRVRSKMGRVVSHPSSLNVTCEGGTVSLSGPILGREVDDLISCVERIPGVTSVENRLEVHEQAGNIPGLQGGIERPAYRFEFLQENWSPTARVVATTLGGTLLTMGALRRDPISLSLGALGLALCARGITNTGIKEMVNAGTSRGTEALKGLKETISETRPLSREATSGR